MEGEDGRMRDGKSGSWPYDHRGESLDDLASKKNKECFSPVEGPLEPHRFSLRKREEGRLEAEGGGQLNIYPYPSIAESTRYTQNNRRIARWSALQNGNGAKCPSGFLTKLKIER